MEVDASALIAGDVAREIGLESPTVAARYCSVLEAEPIASELTAPDSELVTELETVGASFLHCRTDFGNPLPQDSIHIATCRLGCSGFFQETWQHCQAIAVENLVQKIKIRMHPQLMQCS